MRDIRALEISLDGDIEIAFCDCAQLDPNHALDFLGRPDEELPFLAFAVGILGRVEASLRTGHFAQHVFENLARDADKLRRVNPTTRLRAEPREERPAIEERSKVANQPPAGNPTP